MIYHHQAHRNSAPLLDIYVIFDKNTFILDASSPSAPFLVKFMYKRTIRSSVQITAEILSLCKHPQSKTHVMYKTNLSWECCKKYLIQLQSHGFLEIPDRQTTYATTQKGLEFIEKWREVTQLLETVSPSPCRSTSLPWVDSPHSPTW